MSVRLVRCQELLEADVDGEIVGLSVEKGQCYGMNGVASEIWRMLAEPKSVDDLCAALTADYAVDEATCRADILPVLRQLRAEGLIAPAPSD